MRVVRAAPAELAEGTGLAASADVRHDGEAQPEPDARPAVGLTDVIRRHQCDRRR